MKLHEIEIDSKKLNAAAQKVEDVFMACDLNNKEVYSLCQYFLIASADAMFLSRSTVLLNVSNLWDTDSKLSSQEHKDKLQ
jgi:hypothetical protein